MKGGMKNNGGRDEKQRERERERERERIRWIVTVSSALGEKEIK